MHFFKDNRGRSWCVDITVQACKRIKGISGVEVQKLIEDGMRPLSELLDDPVRFVDVLWAVVSPQAKKDGVIDEDFGESLAGDSLYGASQAFVKGVVDFFPNARVRESLKTIIAESEKVQTMMMDRAQETLARTDWDQVGKKFLEERPGLGTGS